MESALMQKLNSDLKQSMKDKTELRTSTIRLLISAIRYAEMKKQDAEFNKNPGADLKQITMSDADILGVIAKEIKQREDSITAYKAGNRQDLADKESTEMTILKAYMPQQLSPAEITVEARAVIAETGARGLSDKGKVMGKLVAKLKGKADGQAINSIVTDILSKM
ncbi:MAG TPA: GatB/YqeY domain-containing protein [Dehalococcoidales bacterium]|nr:GatB/YqeY domain-containing protein [Dehalococcoidales bacterium]